MSGENIRRRILSIMPAPPERPMSILFVYRDLWGWIAAYVEPVVGLAVVEATYYTLEVLDLPPHPDDRLTYQYDQGQEIEVLVTDPNHSGQFIALSTLEDFPTLYPAYRLFDNDEPPGWESIIYTAQEAQRMAEADDALSERLSARAKKRKKKPATVLEIRPKETTEP